MWRLLRRPSVCRLPRSVPAPLLSIYNNNLRVIVIDCSSCLSPLRETQSVTSAVHGGNEVDGRSGMIRHETATAVRWPEHRKWVQRRASGIDVELLDCIDVELLDCSDFSYDSCYANH